MLILSRRPGQAIVFPEAGLTVRVINGQKNTRLGIDAPRHLSVVREELYQNNYTEEEKTATAAHIRRSHEALGSQALPKATTEAPAARLMHAVRNHVNKISLASQLRERFEVSGEAEQAAIMSGNLQRHLDELVRLCDPASEMALDSAMTAVADGFASAAGAKRLLVVEDDRDEREMFANLLSGEGYAVTATANGDSGLQVLSECKERGEQFDALLVDMQMPICNGAEMIHLARQSGFIGETPVLAVSGRCPSDYGLPLGDEGAQCWLPKPIDPKMLIDRLDQCLTLAN